MSGVNFNDLVNKAVVGNQNFITVNNLNDLPTPAAGVITLADNTTYLVCAIVNIGTNRIVFGSSSALVGFAPDTCRIVGSGTGVLLTATGVPMTCYSISFDNPNGEIFSFAGGGTNNMFLVGVNTLNCTNLGTIDQYQFFFAQRCIFANLADGFTFTGANTVVGVLHYISFQGFTGTAIDLGTSTHADFEFDDIQFTSSSATGVCLSGLASSGNIVDNARVTGNRYQLSGGATRLSGVNPQDLKWSFQGNSGLQDSTFAGYATIHGNATSTVISAVDTPTAILGTWNAATEAKRFTFAPATGIFTYVGIPDRTVTVFASVTLTPDGGGTKDLSVYVALNGTVIVETQSPAATNAKTAVPVVASFDIDTNDTIQLWVENNDDGTNITVEDASFSIR